MWVDAGLSTPGSPAGRGSVSSSSKLGGRGAPVTGSNAAEAVQLASEGGRVLPALLDGIQVDFQTLVSVAPFM